MKLKKDLDKYNKEELLDIIFTLVELGSFLDIILLQKKLDKSCFAIFLTFLYIFSGVLNDS